MTYSNFDELNKAFELAQHKRRQGDLLGAYNDLCEIFTDRLLNYHLIDADLKVIQFLADLAGLLEQFQVADDLLCGAIGLYEEANSESWADYTRIRRIQLCLDRVNLSQAQDLLQEMAPRIGNINRIKFYFPELLKWETSCFWRGTEPEDRTVLFAELYLAMGRLLAVLGQYGDAIVALERGLFHVETKNAPSLARQTALPLKLAIASALLEKGQFDDTDTYLKHLQNQLEESQQPEYFIRWLELSGKLNLLRGNLGAGLKQFQQIEEKCRQFGSQRAVLRSTLNLAQLLILLNKTSVAQDHLNHAQVHASAIRDPALAARAEFLLQLCYARSCSLVVGGPVGYVFKGMHQNIPNNQPVVIQVWGRRHLSIKYPNYLTWFEDRALAFQWHLSNLNMKAAGDLIQQIKEVFQSTDSEFIKVQIRILDGTFAYYQGREKNDLAKIERARQILEKVSPQLEEMDLKQEHWQVLRILGWCRTALKFPVAAIEAVTRLTNQLLEEITSSLDPEDQAIFLLNKWTADEEYIAIRITQLQRLQHWLNKDMFCLRPWRRLQLMRKLNDLVEHIDQYKDVQVKRTIKGDSAIVPFLRPSALWRRLLTHPRDRVTLIFLILPDHVLVVKTGQFLFDFRVIATTRIALRNLVQGWYKTIEHARDLDFTGDSTYKTQVTQEITDKMAEITDKMANILKLPEILDDLPERTRSLTIVPDDILHGFPFAAIFYQGQYLIKSYALSIAYESKGRRLKPALTYPRDKALIVGVSNGNNQFRSLPGVESEINRVKSWLEYRQIKPLILKNNSAHKTAVIESISQATLLHIACHGTLKLDRPDLSGLVLIDDSEQEDILSLRELSQLNLTKLRHTTLSSCWSAEHFILPRRWIISLPETLWRSGTQSILGCLWQVDDTVAVSFMERFYGYLDRFPRDEALRRTQLYCLECDDIANPRFWAGFNLYGDYTALWFGGLR